MSEKLVTIVALLKNQGHATGQFGMNRLGDLNHMLPTNLGVGELFFGNRYHLNAEEEPEMYDCYPEKNFPGFRQEIGPSGVIRSWAIDKDDPTEMRPALGPRRQAADRRYRAPCERADITSNTYCDRFIQRAYILYEAWTVMDMWAATFKFPACSTSQQFHDRRSAEDDGGSRRTLTFKITVQLWKN